MSMTVDERLVKLIERHEALTQSVELIAHTQEAHDRQIAKLIELSGKDAENIRGLARLVENHERRLSDLES